MKPTELVPIVFALLATRTTDLYNVEATNTKRFIRNTRTIGKDDDNNKRNLQVDIQPRIVGGSIADGTDYPFYAIPIGGRGLCGATLVHPDILVSAAHCAGIFERNTVALGTSVITGDDALETISVETEYPHPDFSYNTLQNDVMVIKLSSASTATPVTLNNVSSTPSDSSSATVIGFGSTYEGGRPSQNLLEVQVEIVDYDTCYNKYWQPFWGSNIVDDKMICAGTPADSVNDADSCQGDSGGPLLTSSGSIIGIVSFGSGCGRSGIPGVYTRVSGVLDFIRSGICALSDTPPDYCDGGDDGGDGGTIGSPVTDDSTDEEPPATDDSMENPPEDEDPPSGGGTEDESDCTLGCTFAWVFSGVVLHYESGTSCEEVCAFAYVNTFLSQGYKCGLCPSS
jgi:trypsin